MVGDKLRFPARRENNHHFMLPPGHSQANDLRTAAVVSASANAVCTPRYQGGQNSQVDAYSGPR